MLSVCLDENLEPPAGCVRWRGGVDLFDKRGRQNRLQTPCVAAFWNGCIRNTVLVDTGFLGPKDI